MTTHKKYLRVTQLVFAGTVGLLCQLDGGNTFGNISVGTITVSVNGTATTPNSLALGVHPGHLPAHIISTPEVNAGSSIGGLNIPEIAQSLGAVGAATNANTPNTIVMRDATGHFSTSSIALDALDLFSTSTLVIAGNVAVQGNASLGHGKTLYVDHVIGAAGGPVKDISVNNITIYGNMTSPSDKCLKKDITDLDNELCLALVNQLVPHEFDYIPEVKKAIGDDGSRHVGFIAQELAKVDPRFVSIASGTQKLGDLTTQDLALVKQELFIPLLVGALKAELAEIQKLQDRVNVLEARHAAH